MKFFEAFQDELAKLADDSVTPADTDQQEFNPPTPDQASPSPLQGQDQPPTGPETAGDFSGSDARRELQGMLSSTEGRQRIREAFTGHRTKIDDLIGIRKAFNRGLVRAHGHARALLGLEHAEAIRRAAQRVAREGLSVRATEAMVRALLSPRRKAGPARESPALRDLAQRLQRQLGARCRVIPRTAASGRLEIQYASLEELDGILARIGA